MQTAHFLEAWGPHAAALSTGLLVARLVFGLSMSAHGAQKLFGWFGGYGLNATGEFFVKLGFRPARAFAAIASLTEVVGGLLIALGLLGPVGPALMLSVMIVAAVTVHWSNGYFATANGIELPVLYATVAVVLAFTGPGLFSLDALLGLETLWSPVLAALALVVGVIGGIGNLAARRRAPSGGGAGLRTT
jgi:putative oxidoreductase